MKEKKKKSIQLELFSIFYSHNSLLEYLWSKIMFIDFPKLDEKNTTNPKGYKHRIKKKFRLSFVHRVTISSYLTPLGWDNLWTSQFFGV